MANFSLQVGHCNYGGDGGLWHELVFGHQGADGVLKLFTMKSTSCAGNIIVALEGL